jgi:hypothetical protein
MFFRILSRLFLLLSMLSVLSVPAFSQSLPIAPAILTASAASSSAVLNWTAVSGATSYKVYEAATLLTSGITTNQSCHESRSAGNSANEPGSGTNPTSDWAAYKPVPTSDIGLRMIQKYRVYRRVP